MPCYEVRTMSVEFKAENRQLLDAAIRTTDLNVTSNVGGRIEFDWGEITLDVNEGKAVVREGSQSKLNELKRAYSKECIKAACKNVQWNVKFEGQKATVTKMKW